MVVVHPHHYLVVHGQPGRLPDHRADGHAHQLGRRPGEAEGDSIRYRGEWIHATVLQGRHRRLAAVAILLENNYVIILYHIRLQLVGILAFRLLICVLVYIMFSIFLFFFFPSSFVYVCCVNWPGLFSSITLCLIYSVSNVYLKGF